VIFFVTAAYLYVPGYDSLTLRDACLCFLKQAVVAKKNPTNPFLVDIAYPAFHLSHTYETSSFNLGVISENCNIQWNEELIRSTQESGH
jgi:hypothetical protein